MFVEVSINLLVLLLIFLVKFGVGLSRMFLNKHWINISKSGYIVLSMFCCFCCSTHKTFLTSLCLTSKLTSRNRFKIRMLKLDERQDWFLSNSTIYTQMRPENSSREQWALPIRKRYSRTSNRMDYRKNFKIYLTKICRALCMTHMMSWTEAFLVNLWSC